MKVLRMLVDVDEGNGGLKDVRIEDLGKEWSRDGRKWNMNGVKERDKWDRRSLSLHGPLTLGTSRSC